MGTTKKKKPEPTTKKKAPAPPAADPAKALQTALKTAENKIVALEAQLVDLTPRTRLEALKMAFQLFLIAVLPQKPKSEPWEPLAAAAKTIAEREGR